MTVRTLILLRHAKSEYPPGVPDHDRPLSQRGRTNAATIAEHLRAFLPAGASVGAAVSTAVRAQQTWRIAAPGLPAITQQWDDAALYLAEPAQISEVSTCFETDVGIIVGHNPGLEELCRSIPERLPAAAGIDAKFPTAAFAVIALPGDDPDQDAAWSPAHARLAAFVTCR